MNPQPRTSQAASQKRSQEIADELQSVIGDVETFLGQWLGRIQDELSTLDSTAGNAAIRRRLEALQEEKKRWEAKRQRELEQIEQKANLLTEAWLRLESEQRDLLKMQERRSARRESSPANTTQAAPAVPTAPAPPEATPQAAPMPSGPTRRPSNAVAPKPRNSSGAMRSLSDAVRQFEQLRREIEFTRASADLSG